MTESGPIAERGAAVTGASSVVASCTHSRVTTVPVARKYAEVEKRLLEALEALRPHVVCDGCGEKMTREEWHGR